MKKLACMALVMGAAVVLSGATDRTVVYDFPQHGELLKVSEIKISKL